MLGLMAAAMLRPEAAISSVVPSGADTRDGQPADCAAGAGPVLDDVGLAEQLAELGRDDAREHVLPAARRERDDDPVHARLREGAMKSRDQRQREPRQACNPFVHVCSPLFVLCVRRCAQRASDG